MDIIELENKRLIKSIKKGDLAPLISWMDDGYDKLYKIAWSYVYNSHDIEDIFQNTILKIYENISNLRDAKYFETYFISILLNECRQILRNKKREILQDDLLEKERESYSDDYDFFQEINLIDEIYREVIILKYISGYTQEEISNMLNIPIGTVKSRIYRGLRDLRALIKEVE